MSALSGQSKVTFSVSVPGLNRGDGEEVRVVGDCVALGDFEEGAGVPLVTTDATFPVFVSPLPVVVTRGYPVRYRCDFLGKAARSDVHYSLCCCTGGSCAP